MASISETRSKFAAEFDARVNFAARGFALTRAYDCIVAAPSAASPMVFPAELSPAEVRHIEEEERRFADERPLRRAFKELRGIRADLSRTEANMTRLAERQGEHGETLAAHGARLNDHGRRLAALEDALPPAGVPSVLRRPRAAGESTH